MGPAPFILTGRAGRITLGNSLAAIEEGRLAVLGRLAPLDLDPRVINRLEVVLEELIANIVRHGFELGSDQTIVIEVAADEVAITLSIEDDGVPFNPHDAPTPDAETEGGRGVLAVRRFVTDLQYTRTPGDGAGATGRNRVVVRIALPPG